MSDEPGDVLERLMPVDEQAGDDRAATRVGAQVGFDARCPRGLLDQLGDRLSLPVSVDIDRRPPHVGGAGIKIDVLPRETEGLGDSPTLEEEERHCGGKAVLAYRVEQGPGLVRLEGHAG
jgi:hypothetical protein